MSVTECCIKGFKWNGEPVGRIAKLAGVDAYISGNNETAGILIIPDLYGWKFPNVRLLADHYAKESNATVYVPDFFEGDGLPTDLLVQERFEEIDMEGFVAKNSRELREPQVIACAKAVKELHAKVAAVGFCYGGWAALRLGAKEHQPPLVDCITIGHPSLVVTEDIDGLGVPGQFLAPEIDRGYTPELKLHTFHTLQASGLPFDYQHFPGVAHACLVRGNEDKEGERAAMIRGKNAAVSWFNQYLHGE